MAKKTREQYSIEYRKLVDTRDKWQAKMRTLEPVRPRNYAEHQGYKKKFEEADKALTDFTNDLIHNVPGGGTILDFVKDEYLKEPDPTARMMPPGEIVPPSAPAPEANTGMPRQGDFSREYDPTTGEYIETKKRPDPDIFSSEVPPVGVDEEEPGMNKDAVKARIESALKNVPKFTEEQPDIEDPKYQTGNPAQDAARFASDQAKYDNALALYMQESQIYRDNMAGWLDYFDTFPGALSEMEKATIARWKTDQENWVAEHDFNIKKWQSDSDYNNRLIGVQEKQLENTREFQQRTLDLEEIRTHIAAGELKLAAEKAKALNLREIRGQTLKFIEGIADNPEALASLMQSDYGKELLSTLGFGALTEGSTPVDISRFFSGGTAGAGPSTTERDELSESEVQGAMDIINRRTGGDPGAPDGKQQLHDEDGNPVLNEDGSPIYVDKDPYRQNILYRNIRGSTMRGGRFDPGQVRDPGTLAHPNMRQWRNIVRSGQSKAMIFESALSGVGQAELMARIQATRPGAAIRKPQRVFNRSRFQ